MWEMRVLMASLETLSLHQLEMLLHEERTRLRLALEFNLPDQAKVSVNCITFVQDEIEKRVKKS